MDKTERKKVAGSGLSGRVQTVLGLVSPEDLGITLPHEHLLIDVSCVFVEPAEATEKRLAYQPLTLENMGWVRLNLNRSLDNLRLVDEETAIKEAALYQRSGGQTIVDVTPKGATARDPLALARISRATGLNIIMGTAYYVAKAHPPEMGSWTEKQIADEFIREIRLGADDTGIRAGIIGEIGCSWPLAKNEQKVLRAGVITQRETGAPLMIHPGYNQNSPKQIIGILRDAGADLERTIMCHIPRTLFDLKSYLKVAEAGGYLEWDLFGREPYPFHSYGYAGCLPGPAEQIDDILELMARGYEKLDKPVAV